MDIKRFNMSAKMEDKETKFWVSAKDSWEALAKGEEFANRIFKHDRSFMDMTPIEVKILLD